MICAALLAASANVCAFTVNDGMKIVVPDAEQTGIARAINDAAKELAVNIKESTGLAVKVRDVAFVIEGAEGEAHHRVDIVFRCDFVGEAQADRQLDHNQTGMEWLDITTLNRTPLYPSRLRRPIMNLYEGKHGPIYLGNENMGDPEITD